MILHFGQFEPLCGKSATRSRITGWYSSVTCKECLSKLDKPGY